MQYKIYINNQEATALQNKLLSFELQDNINNNLDSLVLEVDNSQAELEVPENDAQVQLKIGLNDLYSMGSFTINQIENTSFKIVLNAYSCNLKKAFTKHNRTFKNISLQNVLQTLASSLGLSLQLDSTLQNKQIDYLLQSNKTDLAIIKELGVIYYAIANIKNNTLIFLQKDKSQEQITLNNDNILEIEQQDNKYKLYNGVKCEIWNKDNASLETIKQGNAPYLIIEPNYSKSLMQELVNNKIKEIKEQNITTIITQGNPNLQAGLELKLNTSQDPNLIQYNGNYKLLSVVHSYNTGYYSCKCKAYKL